MDFDGADRHSICRSFEIWFVSFYLGERYCLLYGTWLLIRQLYHFLVLDQADMFGERHLLQPLYRKAVRVYCQ